MNVAIACGGTGGHLFPGLAVAEVLKDRRHAVLLLISEKQIDAMAVRDRPEFRVEKIPSIGLPRFISPQILPFAGQFLRGLGRCRDIYRSFQPQAVLGMGGFTSTGPILAGRLAGIPTFIHESNAIPGKANRLNARLATRVLLGFEDCAKYFPKSAAEVTGTPIRSSLNRKVDRSEALKKLGLRSDFETVLVMGGSQGAHRLNEAVGTALNWFTRKPIQFIHLTGREDEDAVREHYQKAGIPAWVAAFYHCMEEAYSVADVAVARSGAASLTEISHFGIPSILVPYPYAAENHQYLNAEIFAREGAAEVIEEARVNGDTLGSLIDQLLADAAKRRRMHEQMRSFALQDAAARIAELIERSQK
jgi:UDP-N-acetylglucosamine--N-acetylmuramyl-(pentapeptide) pyrophosphoryl-undecaprenol N-acetylglucosamine transferase